MGVVKNFRKLVYLKNIIIILLIVFTTACSYRNKFFKDADGNTHLKRVYKDYNKQEAYNEKSLFNYFYKPTEHIRYSDKIIESEINNITSLKFDSVSFLFDIENKEFIEIFRSGLLSNKTLFYDDKRSQSCLDSLQKNDSSVLPLRDEEEVKLIVGLIEEPEHLKLNSNKRRFKLWITTSDNQYGYNVYFIEIENKNANKYIKIEDFVKNAKLTFIISPYITI